jgi:hypothetical protein
MKQQRKLRLPLTRRGFRPQPPELCDSSNGEEIEQLVKLRLGRHRTIVQHGEISKQGSIRVQQRGAHIADGSESRKIRVIGKEIQQALGEMRTGFRFDYRLAGRSVDGILIIFNKALFEPEGQGPKTSGFGQILGNQGAVSLQCFAEVSSQCTKKLRAGFRHRALDKKPQDLVFSNPWFDGVLQHDRHEQNLRL